MAPKHTDRIADLKEKRSAAILAQLPTDWTDVPLHHQRVLMQRAELSDDVIAIDEQIHALRAQQILDKHADPDDPFDDDELERTVTALQTQNPAVAAAIQQARKERG